jgi:hypothetical protein
MEPRPTASGRVGPLRIAEPGLSNTPTQASSRGGILRIAIPSSFGGVAPLLESPPVSRRIRRSEESVARYLIQLDTADRHQPSEALATKTTRLAMISPGQAEWGAASSVTSPCRTGG